MLHKKYREILILIITAVLLLLSSGCREKRSIESDEIQLSVISGEEVKESELLVDETTDSTDSGTIRLSPSAENDGGTATPSGGEKSRPASKMVLDEKSIINRYFLLSAADSKNFFPSDFEIGTLIVNNEGNDRYITFINSFFNMLSDKKSVDDYFKAESRVFLSNIFKRYTDRNQVPDRIRIGSPLIVDGAMHFNLRMYKGSGRTEGRIVVAEDNSRLRITDFYGDLSKLDLEYEDENKIFEPETYSF